jgi:hypothetical protein
MAKAKKITFADNSALVTTATAEHIVADHGVKTVHNGTPGSTAFIVDAGWVGNDVIKDFAKNDSLLNNHPIFDNNNDGLINFGTGKGLLDVDRTSLADAGADHLSLTGMEKKALRYLGDKQGQSVYAYAGTKLADFVEGTVNNDLLDGANGNKKFFYDTALGLNLGGDTIAHFEKGDYLVTTSQIWNNSNADGKNVVSFGSNQLLDLPGQSGGSSTDPTTSSGGQIHLTAGADNHTVDHVNYLGHVDVSGVTYYYYGADGSPAIQGVSFA